MQSVTPVCTHTGLGSSHFARRYFGNRVFFLFLRVLRCFSSPGSLPYTMDSCMDDRGLLCRVSPFGHPRIKGYLLLPAAFRSLSRPSSALSAKASALRSFCLTICCYSVNSLAFFPLDDNLSSMSSYSFVVILSDNYGVFQGFISHVCNFQGTILTDVLSAMKTDNLFSAFITGKTSYSFFKLWQPPTLPHRLQCSTLGRLGLNRRVRDGYGCLPQTHRRQKH